MVAFLGSAQPLRVDVTIRYPYAAKYPRAATAAGDAAAAAATDKRQRYGSVVLPVPVESHGGLGADAARSLEQLAAHAAAAVAAAWAAPGLAPKRRAALGCITQFGAADIDLLALGRSPTATETRVAGAAWPGWSRSPLL